MSSRKIQNPGVEINEIDRSQYGKIDYSLPNAPTSLIYGFADKGEDLALTWINSKQTLDDTYSKPTNEYESYFYNAAYEILNKGGTCIAAKLPYQNEASGMYNYVEFQMSEIQSLVNEISSIMSPSVYYSINEIKTEVMNIAKTLWNSSDDIENINNIVEYFQTAYQQLSGNIPNIPTLEILSAYLCNFIYNSYVNSKYISLYFNDNNLTSYIELTYSRDGKDSIENLDKYLTNSHKVNKRTVRIYDMTRIQYSKLQVYDGCVSSYEIDEDHNISGYNSNDCLGIVPVIVTPANALFFQNVLNFKLFENVLSAVDYTIFSQLSTFSSEQHKDTSTSVHIDFSDILSYSMVPFASIPSLSTYSNGSDYESLSRMASMMFPQITFNGPNHYDTTYLKQIGVVVFKAYADGNNNGKMNFQLLESFVGSFDKTARDPITKANIFIDDVINSKSNFIRFFSNADQLDIEKTSTYVMSKQPAISLGFYGVDCKKNISYNSSIMKPLSQLFANATDKNTIPLDIVVDAGVSNIAQLAAMNKGIIEADRHPFVADIKWRLTDNTSNISPWKQILQKVDNFCKNTRKDCMFIADGIRSFCLDGNIKYIRKTKPGNTVANTIMPKFRYMTNALNSSYSAGYCNWFYQQDYSDSSGSTYFWCPPSIKAAGVYIYCNTYFHPWSAPAGQTRGIITDAVDVAFVPLDEDAGQIYSNQWNYAMSYPQDGIVIEGHKTFQTQKTALDRINVRRLMLYLERRISRIARRFVYEGNTPYTRQNFVDQVRFILEDAVTGNGVKEYAIKCDEELNTTEVIENNEMRCKIAIKPVKCVDFIVIDLIATRQSASVTEEVLR